MFQYAFAFSTSKIVNTYFLPCLADSSVQFLLRYFKLDPFTHIFFSGGYISKAYRKICRYLLANKYNETIVDPESTLLYERQNNVLYKGYFQSEDYFQNYEINLRKKYMIKVKYTRQFNEKYQDFFSKHKTIVIHFRRKDYNDIELESLGGKGYVLPIDYYNTALSTIKDIHSYEVFFIGDDMNSIKKDFELKPNYHFEENSAIVDFQLIQNADIAIIANSTFAWWAAYLSLKPNSRILAPKYWLGFKVKETFPPKIETNKFEWIEF